MESIIVPVVEFTIFIITCSVFCIKKAFAFDPAFHYAERRISGDGGMILRNPADPEKFRKEPHLRYIQFQVCHGKRRTTERIAA